MQKFHVALVPRHPKCEVTFFMASSSEDCHNLPHTPLRTKLGHSYVYLDKTVFISCKSFNHIELVRVLIKKIKIYKPQYSATCIIAIRDTTVSSLCSHNHILFVALFSARPRALRRDRTCFGHRGNCSSVHAKRHEQKRGVLSGIPPLSADAVSSLEPVGSTVSLPPTPNHVSYSYSISCANGHVPSSWPPPRRDLGWP